MPLKRSWRNKIVHANISETDLESQSRLWLGRSGKISITWIEISVEKKWSTEVGIRSLSWKKINGQTWGWMKEGIPCIWSNQNSYINSIKTHLICRYHIEIFSKQTAESELITIFLTCVLKFNYSLPSSETLISNP